MNESTLPYALSRLFSVKQFSAAWFLFICLAGPVAAIDISRIPDSAFTPLFNGKDFEDWDMHFSGHPYNTNPDSTVKVDENGYLFFDHQAPYKEVGFGHIGYRKKEFSYYLLRVEYKFEDLSGWAPGYPSYTKLNSGVHIHTEPLDKMPKNKKFPRSVEVQLLGSLTARWCQIETRSYWENGDLMKGHCLDSKKPNTNKDVSTDWIRLEVLVLSDSLVRHIVEGDTVMSYIKVYIEKGKVPLKKGYVALQAEGQSLRFRKVDIVELIGCMDDKAVNYQPYYVKEKSPSDCIAKIPGCMNENYQEFNPDANTEPEGACKTQKPGAISIRLLKEKIEFRNHTVGILAQGPFSITVQDLQGRNKWSAQGNRPTVFHLPKSLKPGLYLIHFNFSGFQYSRRFVVVNY